MEILAIILVVSSVIKLKRKLFNDYSKELF